MQEITVTPLEALAQLKAVASLVDTAECKDEAMYNELQGALVVAQTALAMAPKQEAPEPVAQDCGAGLGTGWVSRDADIGTEQECFSCDCSGKSDDAAPAAANGALTDADILGIIWKYSSFISVGNYSSTQFDCQADTLNCVRAILAAAGPDASLVKALEMAVRQNESDMLMTGEECRQCRAALSGAKGN